MFKKADGRSGFSFGRLITNMIPNMANDAKDDVDLSPLEKDLLFTYQLTLPDPKALGVDAFHHGGICPNQSTSKQVHSSLVKNGCLNKETGLVDTTRVTKNFSNQVAAISIHAQRKLIGLLFFWEDEVTRWNLMEAEEAQIGLQRSQLGEDIAARENLDMVLKVLHANRVLVPSKRQENGAPIGDLPTYSQSTGRS